MRSQSKLNLHPHLTLKRWKMAACSTDCWQFLSQAVSGCHTHTLNTQMHMSRSSGGCSVSCAKPHAVPCSTWRALGLETPKSDHMSCWPAEHFAEQRPPYSSLAPLTFGLPNPFCFWKLADGHKGGGEGRQKGFLPSLVSQGPTSGFVWEIFC